MGDGYNQLIDFGFDSIENGVPVGFFLTIGIISTVFFLILFFVLIMNIIKMKKFNIFFYTLLTIPMTILFILSLILMVKTQGFESNTNVAKYEGTIYNSKDGNDGFYEIELKDDETIKAKNIYNTNNERLRSNITFEDGEKIHYFKDNQNRILKVMVEPDPNNKQVRNDSFLGKILP